MKRPENIHLMKGSGDMGNGRIDIHQEHYFFLHSTLLESQNLHQHFYSVPASTLLLNYYITRMRGFLPPQTLLSL